MKVICTTSNKYLHLIQVFTYLFNKYWSSEQEVTILGYDKPKCLLPANFTFYSMGKQGPKEEWSTDLRKYFEQVEDDSWCWLMEDTFLKRVDLVKVARALVYTNNYIGRFDLTNDVQKRFHKTIGNEMVMAMPGTSYLLSTQPSIWNRNFLLEYLTPGLDPWAFEKQNGIDSNWEILGFQVPAVKHNEGVRKFDPHQLDLNGFPEEDVKHIQSLL
jgi:hypothetical protein